MITRYGPTAVVRAIETAVPQRDAQVVVSTVHKAKGLEWEQVKIAGDFQQPRDQHTGRLLPIPRPDAMLAYVAVIRAKLLLDTDGLSWVHAHHNARADVDNSFGSEQTQTCAVPSNQSRPHQIRPIDAAPAGTSTIEDPRGRAESTRSPQPAPPASVGGSNRVDTHLPPRSHPTTSKRPWPYSGSPTAPP